MSQASGSLRDRGRYSRIGRAGRTGRSYERALPTIVCIALGHHEQERGRDDALHAGRQQFRMYERALTDESGADVSVSEVDPVRMYERALPDGVASLSGSSAMNSG
jgi:hypothetical protein